MYTTLRLLYLNENPSQILKSQAKLRVVFNYSLRYRAGYQNFTHISNKGNTYYYTLRSFKLTARTPQNYVGIIPDGQKHRETSSPWHTGKTTAQALAPFFNASSIISEESGN